MTPNAESRTEDLDGKMLNMNNTEILSFSLQLSVLSIWTTYTNLRLFGIHWFGIEAGESKASILDGVTVNSGVYENVQIS